MNTTSSWWADEQGNIVSHPARTVFTDTIRFDQGVNSDQLWFRHVNDDLVIQTIGTTDKVTVKNWYAAGQGYKSSEIIASDGKVLLGSEVESLVSAMAAFSPPKQGQTTLPANYQSTLAPVLAANWS